MCWGESFAAKNFWGDLFSFHTLVGDCEKSFDFSRIENPKGFSLACLSLLNARALEFFIQFKKFLKKFRENNIGRIVSARTQNRRR